MAPHRTKRAEYKAQHYFAKGRRLLGRRFRLKEAGEAVNRGLALSPDAVEGHELLGQIALRRKRWKEAEAIFRRALALEPLNSSLMNNLGVALRGQRRQQEAIEAFEEAARLDPRSAVAAANLHLETIRFLGAGVPLILFAIAELRLLTLLPSDHSGQIALMAALLPLLAAPLAVMYLRNRRRLSRTARTFHSIQSRRSRKVYVPLMVLTVAGGVVIVYLGSQSFLADPTIGRVIRVTAHLIAWLVGFPAFATLVLALSRTCSRWFRHQLGGTREVRPV